MSTATQTSNDRRRFGASEVRERPKLAITGVFDGVGVCKTSNSEEYEILDLVFKPTRNSRKVFPKLMFRHEWFSAGFSPKIYKDYDTYPTLAEVREGKKMTVGETYAFVYGNQIIGTPRLDRDGNPIIDKRTKMQSVDRVTNLMAFSGGTMESLESLVEAFDKAESVLKGREAGDFGLVEFTSDEIVSVLKAYTATNQSPELVAIIKQSKMDGNLQDNYEIDSWVGLLDDTNNERLVKMAAKSANKEDVSQRLHIAYQL